MEKCYLETDNNSAVEKICSIFCNSKVHYRVYQTDTTDLYPDSLVSNLKAQNIFLRIVLMLYSIYSQVYANGLSFCPLPYPTKYFRHTHTHTLTHTLTHTQTHSHTHTNTHTHTPARTHAHRQAFRVTVLACHLQVKTACVNKSLLVPAVYFSFADKQTNKHTWKRPNGLLRTTNTTSVIKRPTMKLRCLVSTKCNSLHFSSKASLFSITQFRFTNAPVVLEGKIKPDVVIALRGQWHPSERVAVMPVQSINGTSADCTRAVGLKGGYTLVTLPRIVTPYRDSVDGTRDRVTYQKLVTR